MSAPSYCCTRTGNGQGMRMLPRRKQRWVVLERPARNSIGSPYIHKSISLDDARSICRTIRQNYCETIYGIADELGMSGSHLSRIIKEHGLAVPDRDLKRGKRDVDSTEQN